MSKQTPHVQDTLVHHLHPNVCPELSKLDCRFSKNYVYTMGPGSVPDWSDLPLELWINVLSHLRDCFEPSFVWDQRHSLQWFARELSNIHKLRLVCSKFQKALDDAQLSRCLFQREEFENSS